MPGDDAVHGKRTSKIGGRERGESGGGACAAGRCEGSKRGCARTGGASAFDETLARHGAEIYRYALHLTRNRPDADDLYQETALKAFRAWDRLPCDANHRAWLYRIATNTFLSDKRKTSRLRSLDADAAAETIPGGQPG